MRYKEFTEDDASLLYSTELFHLFHLTDNGGASPVPSRLGMTHEMSAVTNLLNPRACIPFVVGRNPNYFGMLAESLWVLSNIKYVEEIAVWNSGLAKYSDDGQTLYGAYGPRMAPHVRKIIKMLEEDPSSRQAVIPIYQPKDVGAKTKDLPCNNLVMFKIRDKALHMTVMNRSNDIHLGLYGVNIPQFSMLMQYVASALGVGLGVQSHVSDSLHLYLETSQHAEITNRMMKSDPHSKYSKDHLYIEPTRINGSLGIHRPLNIYGPSRSPGWFAKFLRDAGDSVPRYSSNNIVMEMFYSCLSTYAEYKKKQLRSPHVPILLYDRLKDDIYRFIKNNGRVSREEVPLEWIIGCFLTAIKNTPETHHEARNRLVQFAHLSNDVLLQGKRIDINALMYYADRLLA